MVFYTSQGRSEWDVRTINFYLVLFSKVFTNFISEKTWEESTKQRNHQPTEPPSTKRNHPREPPTKPNRHPFQLLQGLIESASVPSFASAQPVSRILGMEETPSKIGGELLVMEISCLFLEIKLYSWRVFNIWFFGIWTPARLDLRWITHRIGYEFCKWHISVSHIRNPLKHDTLLEASACESHDFLAPHFGQGGPWVNRRDHLVSVGKTVEREPSCFQGWGWLRLMRMDDAWIERRDCSMD